MESSHQLSLLDIHHDILTHTFDGYLSLQELGRMARVNRRFKELVSKHPLMFLAGYIAACKTQTHCPHQAGVRWGNISLISEENVNLLEKLDRSLRGYHKFLSENHDFTTKPTLEQFVMCVLRDLKWVAASLAKTAQNEKIKKIASNMLLCFQFMSAPDWKSADWKEKMVHSIDWRHLGFKGQMIEKWQLKDISNLTISKIIHIHLLYRVDPIVTFYKNWDFACYMINCYYLYSFLEDVLPIVFREFPEKTQKDYETLIGCNGRLLYNLSLFIGSDNAWSAALKDAYNEKLKSLKMIPNYLKVSEFEPSWSIKQPTTLSEFKTALGHFKNIKKFHDKIDIVPFTDNNEAMLALAKRFSFLPFHCLSIRLQQEKSFILSLAKHFSFQNLPLKLLQDRDFVFNLLTIYPRFIMSIEKRDFNLIYCALIHDPWAYCVLNDNEKMSYMFLFKALIPPESLKNE